MKKFLKAHEEWVLGSISLVLIAIFITIAVWVIGSVSTSLGQALVSGTGESSKIYFKIDELKSINLRGLTPVTK